MSEGLKIALTAAAGVTVFVFGQIIQKWFIEPIQEQKKLIGKILHGLVYYANVQYGLFPIEKVEQASLALRDLSSQALQSVISIPGYRFWSFLHLIPKKNVMINVATQLVEMSNSLKLETTLTCQRKIVKLLNIEDFIPYTALNVGDPVDNSH